jgi:hypothetical protein
VARHKVPTAAVPVIHARWSARFTRWEDDRVELPQNPRTQRGIILTPERFLRELPTVDPAEFWEWSWVNENESIRGEFNYEVATHVDAETIARFARQNPHIAQRYLENLEEHPKDPYDLDRDPALEVRWYELGAQLAAQTPLAFVPRSPTDFRRFIESIVQSFTHNVEEQDGWLLLWNDGRPRAERIVQALFRSTVIHYCRANDIDLTGEANAGRGPVDFKFSQGWQRRALVEVKLTNNSSYWHGLERQTPQYMRSEEIECGYFLSVGFRDPDFEKERLERVRRVAAGVAQNVSYSIEPLFVDARRKPPASRV